VTPKQVIYWPVLVSRWRRSLNILALHLVLFETALSVGNRHDEIPLWVQLRAVM
jgi:hypothetical protein